MPMMFGSAPTQNASTPGYGAPLLARPVSMHPLVQALLNQPGPQATGSPFGGIGDPLRAMQYRDAASKNNPLLGNAQAGAPSWVNALRFAASPAQGVNPWTYGQGAVPGGTDTAGNYQV